jgi:hypothetical protein
MIKHKGQKEGRAERALEFENFFGVRAVDPQLASQISAIQPTLAQMIQKHVEQLRGSLLFGANSVISAITDRDLYEGVKAQLTDEELSKIRFVNFG